MIPGYPTTVAPGEHDEFLLGFDVKDDGTGLGAIVTCEQCATGYGDTWWKLVCDERPCVIVYMKEGAALPPTSVPYDRRKSSHTVSMVPLGDWNNDLDIDCTIQQQYFESDKGQSLMVDFPTVVVEQISYEKVPDGSRQLTSWNLSGMNRWATIAPVNRQLTAGRFDISLVTSGAVRTLTLSFNGYVVAQGTRTVAAGNGSITLSAVNNSGISGTVTLTYTGDIASTLGAFLLLTWAHHYTVTNGTVSTTVYDNGRGNTLSAMLSGLAAGNSTITITPYSDTGQAGSPWTAGTANIPGPPGSPGVLSVVAGGAWNNTQIQFSASSTGSATYNLYDSALDQPTAISQVAATHVAGGGTITWTLPNLAGAAAGKRRIIVTAMNGGIEDGKRQHLTIEYDASGNVVLPRPNVPDFRYKQPTPVTGGRTLNIQFTYNTAGDKGPATKVQAFIIREDGKTQAGTTQDYSSPDATVLFSSLKLRRGLYRGSLTVTPASNGFFAVVLKAVTAGSVQSSNTTPTDFKRVSNVAPGNPASATLTVVS